MRLVRFLFFGFVFFTNISNISAQDSKGNLNNSKSVQNKHSSKMKLKIGGDVFMAIIYNNETTKALKAILPLNINMTELNGNEKFKQLSSDLPASAEAIGTIRAGDIMLWGSNTLVIFYKTFKTTYPYTKIGYIENTNGLDNAVGSGSIWVSFSLE